MSFVSLTVMADLPLSIHSLSLNEIGDGGVLAIADAMKTMANLQVLK